MNRMVNKNKNKNNNYKDSNKSLGLWPMAADKNLIFFRLFSKVLVEGAVVFPRALLFLAASPFFSEIIVPNN